MNVQVNQNERLIRPSDPAIRYTGRIDNSNPDAPFLIYVCSQVEFRVTGRVLRVFIENIHSFYENRLGVIINGVESAVLLESGAQVLDLSERMTDGENHVLLFKRQDCCHALVLHGFAVAEDAELLPLPPRPKRRFQAQPKWQFPDFHMEQTQRKDCDPPCPLPARYRSYRLPLSGNYRELRVPYRPL